jgi:hypothetical protein
MWRRSLLPLLPIVNPRWTGSRAQLSAGPLSKTYVPGMNITRITFVAAAVFLPSLVQAQATAKSHPAHGISMMGGAFSGDPGDGGHHPYLSARYERWLSRFVAFEGGVTHAQSEGTLFSQVAPFETRQVAVTFSSSDLGLQLQLPFGHVRPYVGATIGATYLDDRSRGDREVGLTHAVLAGARVGRFRGVSLRGELRLRRDDIAKEIWYNGEYGLGLTYNF